MLNKCLKNVLLIVFVNYFFVNSINEKSFAKLHQVGNKLIMISKAEGNWFWAMEYCSSLGLRLLTIQNAKENYLMQEFFAIEAPEAPPVWTSGTDLGSEGNWIWMSTGNLVQYSNWTFGEPSNTPIDNDTEDCLQLNMMDGALKWDDCLCFSHKKVVCENIIF